MCSSQKYLLYLLPGTKNLKSGNNNGLPLKQIQYFTMQIDFGRTASEYRTISHHPLDGKIHKFILDRIKPILVS